MIFVWARLKSPIRKQRVLKLLMWVGGPFSKFWNPNCGVLDSQNCHFTEKCVFALYPPGRGGIVSSAANEKVGLADHADDLIQTYVASQTHTRRLTFSKLHLHPKSENSHAFPATSYLAIALTAARIPCGAFDP